MTRILVLVRVLAGAGVDLVTAAVLFGWARHQHAT